MGILEMNRNIMEQIYNYIYIFISHIYIYIYTYEGLNPKFGVEHGLSKPFLDVWGCQPEG